MGQFALSINEQQPKPTSKVVPEALPGSESDSGKQHMILTQEDEWNSTTIVSPVDHSCAPCFDMWVPVCSINLLRAACLALDGRF